MSSLDTTPSSDTPTLAQRLGLYSAAMLIIGSMIGSGIFKKPATMAQQLHSPWLLLGTWIIAGIVTCFGALSNAEVAGIFPHVGGQYTFFRHIYNDFVGYLYGWAVFAVIQTGSIAGIAYVFAEYLGYFVPLPRLSPRLDRLSLELVGPVTLTPLSNIGVKLVTSGCIALHTLVNVFGVVFGGMVQNLFTTFKLAAVAALVLLAFVMGPGSSTHFSSSNTAAASISGGTLGLVGAMAMALSGAFWSYDGWNNVTFVAGEVREPTRNLPRALFLGTVVVVGVYIIVNMAYLYIVPMDQMAGSMLVAALVMERTLGPIGGVLISMLVMLSTFGSTNGSILASSRVSFAMAQDKLFFSPLARIHRRFRTPHVALVTQCVWAIMLVFSGSFDQITDMMIFVSWIFYALAGLGVFVLRRNCPDVERPYRVWGYPIVPAVFVLFATCFVIVTLRENPRDAGLGLGLVALGLPLYLYWRRSKY